jgi:hypothetical protein
MLDNAVDFEEIAAREAARIVEETGGKMRIVMGSGRCSYIVTVGDAGICISAGK